MNIKQALKQKNKLVSEIKDLYAKFNTYNSFEDGQERPYDPQELYNQWLNKTNELITLKTSIHVANSPIFGLIFRMSELKTLSKGLRALNTLSGKKNDPYGRGEATLHNAVIGVVDRDVIVKRMEDEIESIQEQLDKFNATTNI